MCNKLKMNSQQASLRITTLAVVFLAIKSMEDHKKECSDDMCEIHREFKLMFDTIDSIDVV